VDNFIHQGGLAVVNVSDDGNIPNVLGHVLCFCGCKGTDKKAQCLGLLNS
jgi:hypothetical protein